tara:strand:- start:4942 stop:5082 length:141 start_codon:yes stop_codon:yes gene_type:complete
MPNIGGKKFDYTPEGIEASKIYKKKPERMDVVERPPYKAKKKKTRK